MSDEENILVSDNDTSVLFVEDAEQSDMAPLTQVRTKLIVHHLQQLLHLKDTTKDNPHKEGQIKSCRSNKVRLHYT